MKSEIENTLVRAVHGALSDAVTCIVNEEAEAAAKRVNERVRADAAQIAATVIGWTNMSMNRDEIQVTIKLPPQPGNRC